jgi:SulP family sulfate permease
MFPLHLAGVLKFNSFGRIIAPAFAIAVLIAVESLQAIDVATSLTGESTNPDGELLLQGGGNLTSAFVGGLPVSGVSADTLENVPLGAQTPVGGVLQAVFLVVFLLIAAPVVQFTPFPVISAVILSSLFSMTMWREILQLMKAQHLEAASWAATSLLTILADLPTAVSVGMLIGMSLYLRKLRERTRAKPIAHLPLW